MSDYIIRATAADNKIRAFAATTRDLVEHARNVHNTSPVATAALGRLLTAGSMMGSMLKNAEDLLTLQIKSDGPIGGITVTADSRANVKGYVNHPGVMLPPSPEGKLDVGRAVRPGILSVIMDQGMKEPYASRTKMPSGEIAEDITYYYAVSEQTPSSVALGVLMNRENTVRNAAGFIIQLMPSAGDEIGAALEKRISGIRSITSLLMEGLTPEDILERILGDMGLVLHGTMVTRFQCNCSREKAERAIMSMGRQEIREMIEDNKPVEVNCHFCNSYYNFTVDDLKKMISCS